MPDFVATIRFDQGAARCVRYLLDNPAAQVPDPEFDSFCENVIKAQEQAKATFFSLITS